MLYLLIVGLAVWLSGCAYAGYRNRFGLFVLVTLTGMSMNTVWMVLGLEARPFSPPAMMAHFLAFLHALSALGLGWLAGQIARRFRQIGVTSQ